jgi:PKD repeat protein
VLGLNPTHVVDLATSCTAVEPDFEVVVVGLAATVQVTTLGPSSDYGWDFGDGDTTGRGPRQTHAYDQPGEYDITLWATGEYGSWSVTRTVRIDGPWDFGAIRQSGPRRSP